MWGGGGGWGWGWGGRLKKREGAECPHFQSAAYLPLVVCLFQEKGKCKDLTLKQSYFYFHVKWLVKKGYMWQQEERYTNTLQKLLIKTYNNIKNKALVPNYGVDYQSSKDLLGFTCILWCNALLAGDGLICIFIGFCHDKWLIFTLDIKIVLLFWSFLLPLELPLKLFFISLLFLVAVFFALTIMNTLYLLFSLSLHD